MEISYWRHADFDSSCSMLQRHGGHGQKKASEVLSILGKISIGDPTPLKGLSLTNNGESRIGKCLKYDLGDGYRLVTVQDSKLVLFCFVGKHENTEKWIERNKGFTIGVNTLTSQIVSYRASISHDPTNESHTGFSPFATLIDQLPVEYKNRFINFFSAIDAISISKLVFTTPPVHIESISKCTLKKEHSATAYSVLKSILDGDTDNAILLIDDASGTIKPLNEFCGDKNKIVIYDSERIKTILPNQEAYASWIRKLLESGNYQTWMLFMHPDQQEIIDKNYNGPVILSGVSGSGKTCIIIHRAIRLARENKKVLVLTLNQSLSALINELLDYACPEKQIRDLITCRSFFSLCQDLLVKFEPQNSKIYDSITWKTNEHVDQVWREFYRCEVNNTDADVLFDLHKQLLSRSINAEAYIRQEFDWMRSVASSNAPEPYFAAVRAGRAIPFPPDDRRIIAKGILAWKEKMNCVGITDYLNLSSTLLEKYFSKLVPLYHHVLVDEAQDFGTIELKIIRTLTFQGVNDLFFAGDITQTILPKQQSFKLAEVDVHSSRRPKILKNYRNSKEILEAAYTVLINAIDECDYLVSNTDLELLDPKYANFHSNMPILLQAETLKEEIKFAFTYANEIVEENPEHRVCICFSGYSMYELISFAEEHQVQVLDGSKQISAGNIFISDLEQMKGFEFDHVFILNSTSKAIPDPHLPPEEKFRDLCRLYVAMTRAKAELIISFHQDYSVFFTSAINSGKMGEGRWDCFFDYPKNCNIDEPIAMPQFVDAVRGKRIAELSGRQFLYTDYAVGLSKELVNKIDILIDGRGMTRGNTNLKIKWKNIGDAYSDLKRHPHAKQLFGAKTHKEFLDFFSYFCEP